MYGSGGPLGTADVEAELVLRRIRIELEVDPPENAFKGPAITEGLPTRQGDPVLQFESYAHSGLSRRKAAFLDRVTCDAPAHDGR